MSHHRHRPHNHRCNCEGPGVIRRVTQGLADKLGVSRKLVLAAFIVGLIFNLPLTVVVFLVALYWINHPGRLEKLMENIGTLVRSVWSHLRGGATSREAYAGAGGTAGVEEGVDFDFQALRAKFADLERRARTMEKHVSSREFRVAREIDQIHKENDDGKP